MESPGVVSDDVTEYTSGSTSPNGLLRPIDGQLFALKTRHEVQALTDTVDALVIALPKKLASRAVPAVKPFYSTSQAGQATFQHLRKFVDTAHLPIPLQQGFKELSVSQVPNDQVVHFLILPPLPEDQVGLIAAFRKFVDSSFPLVLRPVKIPLYAPVSQQLAQQNSERYWPCSYNPAAQTIQNTPSYHTLRKVTTELTSGNWQVGHYMRLAQQAADEAYYSGLGRRSGAVAVDSNTGHVVAVAGDARWLSDSQASNTDEGRPEHHSLMRVVAMVAAKERETRSLARPDMLTSMDEGETPLTNIEKEYYGSDSLATPAEFPPSRHSMPAGEEVEQLGYLCANLDIYSTHEPCVMCSMGMVHSRFRACVFAKRMIGTGGLCAEMGDGGIGYGLCWRKELNWRVMTFEYKRHETPDGDDDDLFHA